MLAELPFSVDVITLSSFYLLQQEEIVKSLSKRSTIYLDNDLHTALRLNAAATHRSLSEIVNGAVRRALGLSANRGTDTSGVAETAGKYDSFRMQSSGPIAGFRKNS